MYKKLIVISTTLILFSAGLYTSVFAESLPKVLRNVVKDAKNVVDKNQLVSLGDTAKSSLQVIDDTPVSITPTSTIISVTTVPTVTSTIIPTSTIEPTSTIVPTTILPTTTIAPVLGLQTETPISPTPQVEVTPVVLKSINMNNISVAGSVVATPVEINPTSQPKYLDTASEKAAKNEIVTPKSEKTNNYSILLLPAVILIFAAIVNGVYLLGNFIQNKKMKYHGSV